MTNPRDPGSLLRDADATTSQLDGRTLDTITGVRTSGSGALSPTDGFAQAYWQSWTNIQYDNQHRTTGQSVYFLIPSSGSGTVGTNYGQTTYGYDSLERRNRVEAPGGTITRTVWTTPQRVQSVWVGTNDYLATDANPAGSGAPNNMVIVTSNVYDGGSAGGDGNLTAITRYISATSGDTRVTNFAYDFRDRNISMTDATGRYFLVTIDNLGRRTLSQGYSSVGGTLFAQKQTKFDDLSRPYQTLTFAVFEGSLGNALIGNVWRDPSGNILQSIAEGDGKAFTKSSYNGVNWVLSSYRGYNPSGTSYTQAGTVSGDIIIEQTINTYDEGGNRVSAAVSQRLNDANTSTTGALTSAIARISYVAAWVDGIDRNIAGANYGAAASFTRPDVPPASSATVLVGLTAYDDAGRAYQATDPMGIVNQTNFDNANRTTATIEDVGGLARTTNFTYTLDNLIATMTAVNATTGNQTTTWAYGTNASSSSVVRNDLLASVTYPDSVSGSDVVSFAYNRQSEPRTITDQRGTIRTLYRDLLGRNTNDCVTTVGSNTDSAVLQIIRAYEIRGMVSTITSTNSATQGAGTIVNQVALSYNIFGQLATDKQSHSGAVTSGTPSVTYNHDGGGSGTNEIRLSGMIYPNGRILNFNSTGLDFRFNRVTSISDTSATLASYAYLGAAFVVRTTSPEPNIWLDLWGGISGVFAGIDLFGRVIDQRWQNNIGSTPTDIDRYKYGYDQNSNRLWKANIVGTAAVTAGLDEFYTYDPLDRLTEMQRGVLNGTNTGITGTPSVEQDWTLDPVGNWSGFITTASGAATLNQTRSTNTVNEITNITAATGPDWIIPEYDKAGNTITMPQVADPTQKLTAIYDAWNRMVIINKGSGGGGSGGSGSSSSGSGSSSSSGPGSLVARYQYDGRNFCIIKDTYSGGIVSETRHFFYTANWQNIEERIGTSTTMDQQYVYGPRYIDELICRDDSTQRLYATQDANFNLTGIFSSSSGVPLERYLFDPYGSRTIMNASWSVLGASTYNWVIGHQGLMIDPESGLIDNRTRPVDPGLGVFGRRDSDGYVTGTNLYEYLGSNPEVRRDPLGNDFATWIGAGTNYSNFQPAVEPPLTGVAAIAAKQLGMLQAAGKAFAQKDPIWSPSNQCDLQAADLQAALLFSKAWQATTPKLWDISTTGGTGSLRFGRHNVVLLTPKNGNPLPPMVLDSFHGPQHPLSGRDCQCESLQSFRNDYPDPIDADAWYEVILKYLPQVDIP